MMRPGQRLRLGLIAGAALATTACSSDPAMWEALALGLDQAAADLQYENANCYWATPPGLPYGANQRYCPGDYGYRDFWIPPESPYWRDRSRDHRRDRHDDRGHRRRK
ncbi:hypothetical protein [Brevundimonas sp.]|uniref:hypothetical protein n=1 Tax=Brevundimonas sp. TaxID=1871086 RepID=UPI002FC69E08